MKLYRSTAIFAAPALVHMSAYANTLTNLIPELYAGLDVVSRELVGFIPSVNRNTGIERAAVGQNVRWPVAPQQVAYDIVPAMNTPEPPDNNIGSDTMAITKARAVPFGWTGEEQLGLSHGVGYLTIQADLFAQGIRTLVNEIEVDLATEIAANGSRAWGTPGTTPFAPGAAGNLADSAQVRKILDDNGAPATDRSLVIDTSAGANVRTMYQLTKVNEAGSAMTLRDGELLNLHGMSIKESAGVRTVVPGATAGTTNTAGYAVGARAITLTAAGTLKKGDMISFAGDANKYVIESVAGNVVTLTAPGLRRAIPAVATAVTVVATASVSAAFPRTAVGLASRAPALPQGGDAAIDSFILQDPRSGLVFEVRLYAGYRKIRAEVGMAWGVKAIKREHIALLLG